MLEEDAAVYRYRNVYVGATHGSPRRTRFTSNLLYISILLSFIYLILSFFLEVIILIAGIVN
jgi:hypothetical protein